MGRYKKSAQENLLKELYYLCLICGYEAEKLRGVKGRRAMGLHIAEYTANEDNDPLINGFDKEGNELINMNKTIRPSFVPETAEKALHDIKRARGTKDLMEIAYKWKSRNPDHTWDYLFDQAVELFHILQVVVYEQKYSK